MFSVALIGTSSALLAWAWCSRRRSLLEAEDERMLEAARAGEDVGAWASSISEEVARGRVNPQTVSDAAALGLVGDGVLEASRSEGYAERYALRAHGSPLVLWWCAIFTALLAILSALGADILSIASAALMLVVAACDHCHRSIPAVACGAMGVFGALAWGASGADVVLFAGLFAIATLALSGIHLNNIGTGDLLLLATLAYVGWHLPVRTLVPAFSCVALLAVLVIRRLLGRMGPTAIAPILAPAYLISLIVAGALS